MSEIWITSDTHFGHKNIVDKMTKSDGSNLRPFKSIEEHDQTIIDNINRLVGVDDKLIILGDLSWNDAGFNRLREIKCSIDAVLGNHDSRRPIEYHSVFRKVYGAKCIDSVILTHIPVHPGSLGSRFIINGHGHLHAHRIIQGASEATDQSHLFHLTDRRYFCCSLEQNNFNPFNFDELKAQAEYMKS